MDALQQLSSGNVQAALDVLKQAVKENCNLVFTYEPTFYSRADTGAPSRAS